MDQEAFAKVFYFAELGRRASEAMAAKVSMGLPSGRIPVGYLASADKTGIERDMEKAQSVECAFELAAEGVSLRKILRAANRRDPQAPPGFHVLSKRWIIEQLFGCWGRNRRLSRDHEQNTKPSRSMLQAASIHHFLRRLQSTTSSEGLNPPPTSSSSSDTGTSEDRLSVVPFPYFMLMMIAMGPSIV